MAERILETRGSCTTVLGAQNMLSNFMDLNYYQNLTSTLNSKYGVNASVPPTEVPKLRYFGCGVKGYKNINVNQGSRRYDPAATNMDLYQPIPIRCVLLSEESSVMTQAERAKYRFRVEKTGPNGQKYACYYLKVLTPEPNTVELIKKDATGTESIYVLDPANLNPVPRDPETGGIVTTTDRIIVRATVGVTLYADEIAEAINNLYNGDFDTYGHISEYGYYTGQDVMVDAQESIVSSGGVNKEAIYVQLAKHLCSRGVDLSESGSSINPKIRYEYADVLEA